MTFILLHLLMQIINLQQIKKLDKLDLSGLNNFGGSYQNVIADIRANSMSDKIENDTIQDSIPTDTTNNLVKENINKYEKIKYSPKKKG